MRRRDLLAAAYPDRIGRRRRCRRATPPLTNGRGAEFIDADRLAQQEFIVAVELDDRDREARIRLAAALDRSDIESVCGERIERRDEVEWSSRDEAVTARRVERLGSPRPQREAAEPAADRARARRCWRVCR